MAEKQKSSAIEHIKEKSDGLRGTIVESLANELTGAIAEDDQALIKFHGMYQQDDRDRRELRAEKKLERLFSFMIRLRLPGGTLTASQWISLHHIAGKHTTGTIKITTRQTVQLHGMLKNHIKPVIQSFNIAGLDSIATCGDINRNVTCASNPGESVAYAEVFAYADFISEYLKPKTRAYYEIWLGEEKLLDKSKEADPLYEDRYLPRKFKIGIAIPPNNDTDVFANDVGLIAVIENDKLMGFNIAIGGGLSTTHGNSSTYARLGSLMGFCSGKEQVLQTIYQIVCVQRDYGNRSDRKQARLKYTLDKLGMEFFKAEVEKRSKIKLEPVRDFKFTRRKDYYGWKKDNLGRWHFTLFVENGRVLDEGDLKIKTALLELAEGDKAVFRFTCNQNLILSDILESDKAWVEILLKKYRLDVHTSNASEIRKNAMACVALSTCPLALAEGQRYLPELIDKIEPLLAKHRLEKEEIILRMTGCPNGCARPYAAEIGLVGTAPGHYNLLLGADREGLRLNKLYRESLDEEAILAELDLLFAKYSTGRENSESFGDYAFRQKWVKEPELA